MPRIRAGYKGKYKLDKHEFYMAYHYALLYQEWLAEYNALADPSTGLRYDKDHVQTSGGVDTTEANGMRRAELRGKMEVIEETVQAVDPTLYTWLLLGVTTEGITFNYLRTSKRMPCGKNEYYAKRRQFYFILANRIGIIGDIK